MNWTLAVNLFLSVIVIPSLIVILSLLKSELIIYVIPLVCLQMIAANRAVHECRAQHQITIISPTQTLPPLNLKKQTVSESDTIKSCCCCLEDMVPNDNICKLPCSHAFHELCIEKWLNEKQICPYKCQTPAIV